MRKSLLCMWVMLLGIGSPALAGTVKASSELKDNEGERHGASLALDGLLSTGWAEGEMGDGKDSWIEIRLDALTEIESISIWPGNLSLGQRSLREFGRPKDVTVTLLGGDEEVSVQARILDPGDRGPLRSDIDVQGSARTIRVSVDEAYSGGIYNDLFIAEIGVNFTRGASPRNVERLNSWLEGDSGKRALDQNRESVVELFDSISQAEFGDRESLQVLMDQAGDGAPFLRRQVQSLVPLGYRVQALRPDSVAIEALLKLKDSNAIPALERAALRSVGQKARRLQAQVETFQAYQDLVGGGRMNIPPFGTTGWEEGALQSLGEPMNIEVDPFGAVWVADVANNRLQRFSFNGIHEQTWGHSEAGIASSWFQRPRTAYVAGSQAGDKSGEFATAVDLAQIPTKDGGRIAVLDGKARVTILDELGDVARVISAPADGGVIPGVGGEAFLVYLKGERLAVVWGNEGWVFSLDGENLGHFELEDGAPTGAVALKNGKLGLIYGKALVMYSLDGFRHGDIMDGALGTGFEAWDITMDDRGKLWAVTDMGDIIKFKKAGKIDYKVRGFEYDLKTPRMAVYDDICFVMDRDEIKKVDALELNARAQLDDQEAAGDAEPEL